MRYETFKYHQCVHGNMIVDLHEHPANFFDDIKEVASEAECSQLPEMRILGKYLTMLIYKKIDFMYANEVKKDDV